MNRLQIALKAAAQLGLQKTGLYALYQLGLKCGLYRLLTPVKSTPERPQWLQPAPELPLTVPPPEVLAAVMGDQIASLLEEAHTIQAGSFYRFGAPQAIPIELSPPQPLQHWSRTSDQSPFAGDIKFIWEPARFGWVFPLGRAYAFQPDDALAAAFWQRAEAFWDANPPNLGPNWTSGQEVALRILAFSFAWQVFARAESSTPARRKRLLTSIACHARRIPPTLIYARAQNNNHLISEAVGLYTAGCLLSAHPQASRWRRLGWRWFNRAIRTQVDVDGTYIQQSMNYHRLMLQAALWFDALARRRGQALPQDVRHRLADAAYWLCAQIDPLSGRAPNLGHNDGAHILPLASGAFADYRPIAQTAATAFLGQPGLSNGPWDETALWLGLEIPLRAETQPFSSPAILRLQNGPSWATLRAARFRDRPAQADQLHVDIWWQGENLALDPGSFRYTAPAPWNNALARTAVHNTILVDQQDQMTPAGRFLWLDWAQAEACPQNTDLSSITAQHTGYRRLGVLHRRSLACLPGLGWQIDDLLLPADPHQAAASHEVCLHWLLPDHPWQWQHDLFTFQARGGLVTLAIKAFLPQQPGIVLHPVFQVLRAGQVLDGPPDDLPTLGWVSPTYASKQPALSLRTILRSPLPVQLSTIWTLTQNH